MDIIDEFEQELYDGVDLWDDDDIEKSLYDGESISLNCITDWWIWNCFFVLWIPESGMVFLNYGLLDPE